MRELLRSEKNRVIAAYVAVCVLWGSTYLAIRIGVSDFPPELFAGIRFTITGILMLLFVKLRGLAFPENVATIRNQAIVGLFLLLGGNGLVVFAEQWVHSGVASLLVATVPLFMALIELFIPGRPRIDFKGWIGLLIGFAGVALLVFSNSHTGSVDIKGAALLMAASLCWAIGSVYSKSFKPTGSLFGNIGIQMLAGGLGLTTTGLLLGEASRLQFTPKAAWAMLYLIFFGSILGYSSYVYVLQKWPAAKAGTYAYVNPPVAVLLGAVVLGEPFSLSILTSTIVILLGVLMVQLSKTTVSPPRSTAAQEENALEQ